MKNFLISAICLFVLVSPVSAQKTREYIYVGTNNVRGSEGIYVFEFNREAATLTKLQTISSVSNPNFLTLGRDGRFLYAAGVANNTGAAGAFSIDQKTGLLTFINQISSQGGGAAHIAVDKSGKYAFVSNYGGGSLAVLPIGDDGSLKEASDVILHSGSSVNPQRQQKSYVHSAYLSPDDKFVVVSDLGTDKIYSYEIDYLKGKVKPAAKPFISVVPGAGPRHLVFHPNGKYIYSAEELFSTVGVFSWDVVNGSLQAIKDTVRSLPLTFTGTNTSADIHTDPKGKYLYISNRGVDAIGIFAINKDGTIKLIGQQETMGKTPRNFFVEPKGEFVFVANQNSDNIVIFKLDQQTGMLSYTGKQVAVPSPVCIKMLQVAFY